MKRILLTVLWMLPVLIAEVAAHLWMNPASPAEAESVLELSFPSGDKSWIQQSEVYGDVQPSLHCSSGWISDVGTEDGPEARVSFFRWDSTDTVNTLEAFKHLPEQCMGAIGMRLENIHPTRELETSGGLLYFDSTQFRPQDGGRAVHIFKCVWVGGFPDSNLRDDALMGKDGQELRQLRLAAAAARFRPRHTRIIMGGVFGMPTEELAWKRFEKMIRGQIRWIDVPSEPIRSSRQLPF